MTTYSCGRCGRIVSKSTRICPYCSAHLAGIRCKNCNFTGSESDFFGDRCPKCGSVVYTGGGSGGGANSPLGWGGIIGIFIASIVLIIGSFVLGIWMGKNNMDGGGVSMIGSIFGVFMLIWCISDAWKRLKGRKR